MHRKVYKVTADNRDSFAAFLGRCDFTKPKRITIEPWVNRRSNSQNSYYWAVVVKTIADETGNDPEMVHRALKEHFLEPETIEVLGQTIIQYTTRKLNTVEFRDYVEKCAAWAASELGIWVPGPGETL